MNQAMPARMSRATTATGWVDIPLMLMNARSPRKSVAPPMSSAATAATPAIGRISARPGRPPLPPEPPRRASRQTMTITAMTTTSRTTPTRSVITRLAGLPVQAGESL